MRLWGDCHESFLGKSAVPVFSATLFPLVSYLSYLPALFLLALLHIPKVMTYFFMLIFLSWFLVWFIPTCHWGLCVAQVWVGRPGRSHNILNLRFLYLDHTYPLYLTGLWWGSNKINLWTCLLKHKRVAFLIFPTSPRSLVRFLPWCPAWASVMVPFLLLVCLPLISWGPCILFSLNFLALGSGLVGIGRGSVMFKWRGEVCLSKGSLWS